MKVFCKPCGFEDEFEPDELGINYYQAIGTCPNCEQLVVDENGDETAMTVEFKVVPTA